MDRAPLDRDPGPRLAQHRGQAGIPVDLRQHRGLDVAGLELLQDVPSGGRALVTDQAHVEKHPLAVGPHPHRHQYPHPHAALAQSHLGIPAIQEQAADGVVGQVALLLRLETGRQRPDQTRDRNLRERPATQQRRQRPADAPALNPFPNPPSGITPSVSIPISNAPSSNAMFTHLLNAPTPCSRETRIYALHMLLIRPKGHTERDRAT